MHNIFTFNNVNKEYLSQINCSNISIVEIDEYIFKKQRKNYQIHALDCALELNDNDIFLYELFHYFGNYHLSIEDSKKILSTYNVPVLPFDIFSCLIHKTETHLIIAKTTLIGELHLKNNNFILYEKNILGRLKEINFEENKNRLIQEYFDNKVDNISIPTVSNFIELNERSDLFD